VGRAVAGVIAENIFPQTKRAVSMTYAYIWTASFDIRLPEWNYLRALSMSRPASTNGVSHSSAAKAYRLVQ
jgi:hypothetical protein